MAIDFTSSNSQYQIMANILQGDSPPLAAKVDPNEKDAHDFFLYLEGQVPYERRFDKFLPPKRGQ